MPPISPGKNVRYGCLTLLTVLTRSSSARVRAIAGSATSKRFLSYRKDLPTTCVVSEQRILNCNDPALF